MADKRKKLCHTKVIVSVSGKQQISNIELIYYSNLRYKRLYFRDSTDDNPVYRAVSTFMIFPLSYVAGGERTFVIYK